jgi:hypothetical protein
MKANFFWVGTLLALWGMGCSSDSTKECPNGEMIQDTCYPKNCTYRVCPPDFVCGPDDTCIEKSCIGKECKENEVCTLGECYPKNCPTRKCPGLGEMCVEEKCVPTSCADVQCPADQECSNGYCYPKDCTGRNCPGYGEVCVDGVCVPATCGGVNCPEGQRCANGYCYPVDCTTKPCTGYGQVCKDGVCQAATCVDITCAEGQVCAQGFCYPEDCQTKECMEGLEVCFESECVPLTCVGVQCPAGQRCANGYCHPESCGNTQCEVEEVCVDGVCVDVLCVGMTCRESEECVGGECLVNNACLVDRTCVERHRVCQDIGGVAVCGRCIGGYHDVGGACVQDQVCLPNSCSGHGTCDDHLGRIVCACESGYSGAYCQGCMVGYAEWPISSGTCLDDPCVPDPCADFLNAVPWTCAQTDVTSYRCTCQEGYAGAHCDEGCATGYVEWPALSGTCVDDPCDPDPCAGVANALAGTCAQTNVTVFQCACESGYMWSPLRSNCTPWLSGWTYRKSHLIQGTTAGVQVNYPMKMIVHRAAGTDSGPDVYLGTNVSDDFKDLRFTASNGSTLLPYWIEVSDTTQATVWVKIPSIPAGPSAATIYLYYGNLAASAVNDGASTFDLFSGFESGTAEGVTVFENSGGLCLGPIIRIDPPNLLVSYFNIYGNCGAYIKTGKPVSLSGTYACGVRAASGGAGQCDYGRLFTFYCGAASGTIDSCDGSMARVEINSTNPSGYVYTYLPAGFCGCAECDCGSYQSMDFMYVRKRATPEPTHSTWGAEEYL